VRAVVTLCWVAGTNTVVFADGSTFDADVVICCTGFCLTFPFLEEWNPDLTKQLLNIRSCLFKHAFHPMYGSEIVWIGAWCGVRGLPLSMSSSVWIVVQRAVVPACYAVHDFHDNKLYLATVLTVPALSLSFSQASRGLAWAPCRPSQR
jgi:hypothetical protein